LRNDTSTLTDIPDNNFDNFFNATISIFIVIANDQWTNIYMDHNRALGGGISTLFFIFLVVLGQWILFNLFLAILLKEFEDSSPAQE
jgi:voltage-dependent calcium channel L type alpha-1D